MLHLISGQSKERKEYIQKLAKQYQCTPHHVYDNDLAEHDISELVITQAGLFGEKEMYVVHESARDLDLKSILPGFAESENIIVFSEASVIKKITGVFEKVSAVIHDFGKEVVVKEEKMNIFSLADAFGKRDKKNLWLLFREALTQASPEEIHGILFWQLKNLMLVSGSSSNPGMNDFVYRKNKSFAEGWSPEELLNYSSAFVRMFHMRDNYRTLEIDLEKIILSL